MSCADLATLSAQATQGEWRLGELDNHSASPSDRWKDYSIEVGEGYGRTILDTLNSGTAEIHEEPDEDGRHAWNEQGKRDLTFIVALVNAWRSGALSLSLGRNGLGASPSGSGSHASHSTPSGSRPVGFDPSRKIEDQLLLVASSEKFDEWFTDRLSDSSWRPNRMNIEAARNAIRTATQAARALGALARVSDEHRHGENAQGAVEGEACQRDGEAGTPDLLPNPLPPPGGGELVAYLHRQWAWSRETFGPALRTKGIVQHITKELREIEAEPHDLAEWVDVIILAMDGFWRHGGKPEDLLPAMQAKQDRNFARTWPDWRTMGEDQAIEHDRSGEPPAPANNTGA